MNLSILVMVIPICWYSGEAFLTHLYPLNAIIYELNEHYLYKLIPNSKKLYVHHTQNGGRLTASKWLYRRKLLQ